jgi:hypothetical protein
MDAPGFGAAVLQGSSTGMNPSQSAVSPCHALAQYMNAIAYLLQIPVEQYLCPSLCRPTQSGVEVATGGKLHRCLSRDYIPVVVISFTESRKFVAGNGPPPTLSALTSQTAPLLLLQVFNAITSNSVETILHIPMRFGDTAACYRSLLTHTDLCECSLVDTRYDKPVAAVTPVPCPQLASTAKSDLC